MIATDRVRGKRIGPFAGVKRWRDREEEGGQWRVEGERVGSDIVRGEGRVVTASLLLGFGSSEKGVLLGSGYCVFSLGVFVYFVFEVFGGGGRLTDLGCKHYFYNDFSGQFSDAESIRGHAKGIAEG